MVALDPNSTPCGGEAPKEELEAPLLDPEIGRPEDATAPDYKGEKTKKKNSLASAFTKFFEQTREDAEGRPVGSPGIYVATFLSIDHATVSYLIINNWN